jgi:hypothetical protein
MPNHRFCLWNVDVILVDPFLVDFSGFIIFVLDIGRIEE